MKLILIIISIITICGIGFLILKTNNNVVNKKNYYHLNENQNQNNDNNNENDYLYLINNQSAINYQHENKDEIKGIFVDFIYNPNFNSELKIVQAILLEILNKTKINYFYDFENLENSTIISVSFEEGYSLKKRHMIGIKPKLLKDIMYNENIFLRIYLLIYNYFRIGNNPMSIPEYDRTINYKKYKKLYENILKKMDHVNFNNIICRDELIYKNNKILCIETDIEYIEKSFNNKQISNFYKTYMTRIAWFVSRILDTTTNLTVGEYENCYKIKIYPEIDIRRVLLLPHSAMITAEIDEELLTEQEFFTKLINLIITIKHRILHSLGLIHKYILPSVMANYENTFQKNNLFFILMEDYEALNQCYSSYNNYPYYVKHHNTFNNTLFNLFINNFKLFREEYLLYHY